MISSPFTPTSVGVVSAARTRPEPVVASKTVLDCYEFFDRVFPECGLWDFTDGMYHGDPTVSYEQAQRNQIEYLLDEVHCRPGSRILDIGCGYGTLLEAARARGAQAVGITISPAQVARCRARGLDVHLIDYRELPAAWSGAFDGIVANGSVEHFVHPRDILTGRADPVYQELFRICHRLIDPRSPAGRFVTTIIHHCENTPKLARADLLKSPWVFAWNSPRFHYAMVQQTFGGFYPLPGQLDRCAEPSFHLARQVDGTLDYHWTSEEWFRRVRAHLRSWRTAPRICCRLATLLPHRPLFCVNMLCCLLVSESWQKQFRGEHPAVRLLRQTWEYVPAERSSREQVVLAAQPDWR